MRTLIIVTMLSSFAMACKTGEVEFHGNCAALPSPEESTLAPMVNTAVSDEKPPTDKMPSYEREGIHAVTPDSLVTSDKNADDKKMCATIKGKKIGHIPLTDEEKSFSESHPDLKC